MTLRELKYVIIGEDRLSHKLNGVARSGYNAGNSLKFQSDRLAEYKQGFKSLANEVPGLSSGLSMLVNPFVLGGAALAGLGVGLKRATDEAQKFNSNFRELQNLNLDKTYGQLNGLKRLVQDTAYKKGFDQNLTSRAFYDVQSVTGKFGGEVAQIVEMQGEFANLMKADFNAWIEGTGKAMANYGFGAEQLKEFNRSAFATVKVGSITFDQLAKVQSVYAGAAASVGQSFNAANKMLTVFTVKTKSADEAATLTKSLFNDLTKESTIKALAKAGVDLFDVNKKVKQADVLMKELNARFKELGGNDKRIIELKNQFSGSEGLTSFVQSATEQAGNLVRTLDNFDSSELGLNKALAIARRDIDYINSQAKNRTEILISKLGENFIPLKTDAVTALNKIMEGDALARKGVSNSGFDTGSSEAVRAFGSFMNKAASLSQEDYRKELERMKKSLVGAKEGIKEFGDYSNSIFFPKKVYQGGFYKGYASTLADIINVGLEKRKNGVQSINSGKQHEQTAYSDGSIVDGLNSVSGGGNAVRNITVNIGKLIETQQVNTQNIKEGTPEIQRLVEEALIRAVAGTEQMISN